MQTCKAKENQQKHNMLHAVADSKLLTYNESFMQ